MKQRKYTKILFSLIQNAFFSTIQNQHYPQKKKLPFTVSSQYKYPHVKVYNDCYSVFLYNSLQNLLSSMLFPKLQVQKMKLSLAQKLALKIDEPSMKTLTVKDQQENSFRNSRIVSGSKNQIKVQSSSSTKDRQFSKNSYMGRNLSSKSKENRQNPIVFQKEKKIQNKSILKLNKGIKNSRSSLEKIRRQQSIPKIGRIQEMKKEFQKIQNHFDSNTELQSNSSSSIETSQKLLKIPLDLLTHFEDYEKKHYKVQSQIGEQTQFLFQNCSTTHLQMTKSEGLTQNSQNQTISLGNKNLSRKVSIKSFFLQSSIYSIKIEPKNNTISSKKRMMAESFIQNEDFEWQYRKFKEYTQKYSEYEVKLKQNFAMLQLLTENIELLKERIIPYRDYTALKEIIEIVKPSMSRKQQQAVEIKTSMMEWKKRFFSSIKKIKMKLNHICQQESRKWRFKLQDNEELAQNIFDSFIQEQKKGTLCLQKENIIKIKNSIQTILLNQKQMIDDIQIFESNNQGCLQKLNLLEEEWNHAFDIFNITLENCAKKCITLSQTIDSFFGKCSSSAFLTKGMGPGRPQDQKLLQNDDCHICSWNKTKIKKIIEQNSLANDHLVSLKHLVAH